MTNSSSISASSFALSLGGKMPPNFGENISAFLKENRGIAFFFTETNNCVTTCEGEFAEFPFGEEDAPAFLRACEALGIEVKEGCLVRLSSLNERKFIYENGDGIETEMFGIW